MASSDQRRIQQLAAQQEARINKAFMDFIATVKSPSVLKAVRDRLEAGDIQGALRIVNSYVLPIGAIISNVFVDVGRAEVASIARNLASDISIALDFDPAYPAAAEAMTQMRMDFINGFTQEQEEVVRAALTSALQTGQGPRAALAALRDTIGMTQTQVQAVSNYQRLLETGSSADALSRALRDRRFDSTVANASTEPLTASQIGNMVDRYRDRMLAYRAETIARTQTLGALSAAREQAVDQVTERTGMSVIRTWNTNIDGRERYTHAAMDGQQRAAGEPFDSPTGEQLMYPGDPNASAAEICNCRCFLTYEYT